MEGGHAVGRSRMTRGVTRGGWWLRAMHRWPGPTLALERWTDLVAGHRERTVAGSLAEGSSLDERKDAQHEDEPVVWPRMSGQVPAQEPNHSKLFIS